MKKQLGHAHWDKTAFVYVRQSTFAQILEHTERARPGLFGNERPSEGRQRAST